MMRELCSESGASAYVYTWGFGHFRIEIFFFKSALNRQQLKVTTAVPSTAKNHVKEKRHGKYIHTLAARICLGSDKAGLRKIIT